jgi:hypothetical protein
VSSPIEECLETAKDAKENKDSVEVMNKRNGGALSSHSDFAHVYLNPMASFASLANLAVQFIRTIYCEAPIPIAIR